MAQRAGPGDPGGRGLRRIGRIAAHRGRHAGRPGRARSSCGNAAPAIVFIGDSVACEDRLTGSGIEPGPVRAGEFRLHLASCKVSGDRYKSIVGSAAP